MLLREKRRHEERPLTKRIRGRCLFRFSLPQAREAAGRANRDEELEEGLDDEDDEEHDEYDDAPEERRSR